MAYGILLIEDEEVLAKNIKRYLERAEYEVWTAASARDGLQRFEQSKPDLVLLDLNLPDRSGMAVLQKLHERDPSVKVIIMTAHGNVQLAVDAMKGGAYDYLSKPVALSELKLVIDKAVGQERLEGALSYYRQREAELGSLKQLLGQAPSIVHLKQRIVQLLEAERRLSEGQPPAVLITGETGTGKELVARALHFEGVRRMQPFIEINCAAIPTHLIESELFGHERGAFTDARERRIGLVESAHSGTLFLDEIGDLDGPMQVKLLKLLEDRTVRRIGSVRDRTVDVRFIAATHRSMEQMIEAGAFRADLYFRLNVVRLHVPPLRERHDDVILLADHFLDFHGRRYGRPNMRLSEEARALLRRHRWLGNVRELRNAIEQAVLSAQDDVVEAHDFSLTHSLAAVSAPIKASASTESGHAAADSKVTLAEVERQTIVQALERSGGNVSRAAQILGITRDTLRYKLEKHNLRV